MSLVVRKYIMLATVLITADYSLSKIGFVAIPRMVLFEKADNVEEVWYHCSDQRHHYGDLVLTVPRHYDFFVS